MPSPRFATTRWSVVLAARTRLEPSAALALRELCESYWYPLYAYLRRDGVGEADAMDLVQGFLADLLARGELGAEPERGRFRSYLIGALRNFRRNAHRAAVAQKRGGAAQTFAFDDAEARYRDQVTDHADPEQLFERNWAKALLNRAIDRLKQEYRDRRREPVFEALEDALSGGSVASYADKAALLGMSESAVKVNVHRMRGRLRELLREEVAQTVGSSGDVDDELADLLAALAG